MKHRVIVLNYFLTSFLTREQNVVCFLQGKRQIGGNFDSPFFDKPIEFEIPDPIGLPTIVEGDSEGSVSLPGKRSNIFHGSFQIPCTR